MYAGITFILLIAGIIGLAFSNRYEKTLLTILFSFIMIVGFVMLVVGDTNYYTAKDQMLFTKNIELHRPGACDRSKLRGHACEAAADGRGCSKCGGACDSGQLPLTEGARADVNSDVMLRGLVSGREEACVMHG